jgi:hypothetical protein
MSDDEPMTRAGLLFAAAEFAALHADDEEEEGERKDWLKSEAARYLSEAKAAEAKAPPPVIPLRIVPVQSEETLANERTIELLEDMLERARRGEVQIIAMVGLGDDSSVVSVSRCPDVVRVIGALELAKIDVIARASAQGNGRH